MSAEGMEYDAARIEVLDGVRVVRKRPGMYVGSTGERGPRHMVLEVVGRAVNEVLAGRAGSVEVTLTADGGVRVADDGSGGSSEADGDTGGPDLEAQLTSLQDEFETRGRHIAAAYPFGVGLFVVNALSSRMTAEVRGEGARRVYAYARGVAVEPPAAVGPATGCGTAISFWPDTEIFETTSCSFTELAELFRQVAFLNRSLKISLTDERPADGPRSVLYQFPDGVRDFVAALGAERGAALDPHVIGFEREDPRMAGTMEVALLWNGAHKDSHEDSHEESIRGFANSRATSEGGTHVDGFRDGVAAAVTAYARKRGLLASADPDLRADRIGEGLTAVVSVKLDRPEFLGCTRGLLGNTDVRVCVAEAVQEYLADWFEEQPERAAEVVDRVVGGNHQD
ncbi:DNA gyrase subunit B [Streptomyces sp. NPDC088350]|uniref:DNA gyrase subunit B n=1 Tax=Streptomyces sp. NPDC088350 TaxID=3365854 RepID=UPI00382AAAEA